MAQVSMNYKIQTASSPGLRPDPTLHPSKCLSPGNPQTCDQYQNDPTNAQVFLDLQLYDSLGRSRSSPAADNGTQPTIMPTTFHGFRKLPPELRLEIWKLAVRPSECGVHFFSMTDRDSLANMDQGSVYNVKPHRRGPLIAAPGFPTELSWVNDNPSTYLVDAGLWTACRESRAVMETRFRTAYWRKKRQRRRKRKSGRRSSTLCMYRHADAPGLACFRQGNEDWTFAVFPHRDLFCFRGVPAASVDVHDDLGQHSPFGPRSLGFDGLRRVAFEFDETWAFDHEEDRIKDLVGLDDPRGVLLETLDQIVESEGRSGMRLFLIDYGLRLKPGASAWQTFHGEGCRFVDHCEEDLDWKRSAGRGAWKFLYEIENWGEAYWSRHNERVTCPGSEFSSVWVSSYITVLACERD